MEREFNKNKEKNIIYKDQIIGRADEENHTHIFEIKDIKDWKQALGQVLVYSYCTKKNPFLKLLDNGRYDDPKKQVILEICNYFNVPVMFVNANQAIEEMNNKRRDWRYHIPLDSLRGIYQKLNNISNNEVRKIDKDTLIKNMDIEPNNLTLKDLKAIAKSMDLHNYSNLNKDSLVSLILSNSTPFC